MEPNPLDLPWWYQPTITVHIILAILGFSAAVVAIFASKRGRLHRRAGRVWVIAMNAAVVLAMPALALRLHGVGIASGVTVIYLSYRGTHIYRRKRERWVDVAVGAFYVTWLGVAVAAMGYARTAPDTLAWTQVFCAGLLVAEILRTRQRPRRVEKVRAHIWSMVLSVGIALNTMAASNWPIIGELEHAEELAFATTLTLTGVTLFFALRRYPLRPRRAAGLTAMAPAARHQNR